MIEYGRELSSLQVLWRLLKLCFRRRRDCTLALGSQILALVLGMVGLGLTGLGIDFLRAQADPSAHVPWPFGLQPPASWTPMEILIAISAGILFSAVVRGWVTWMGGVILAYLVHKHVVARLQRAVFAKLQQMSFRFYDQESRGAIINRATGDIQAVRNFLDTSLLQCVVTVLSLMVYSTYMFSIHAGLAMACLATSPLMWFLCFLFSRTVHPEYMRNRKIFDKMIRIFTESIEGIGVVKGFAREQESAALFKAENAAVRNQQRKIFWFLSLFAPTIDFLSQMSLVVLLIYGGSLVIQGKLSIGMGLVVFSGLLQQFSNQLWQLAMLINALQESLASAGRVFSLLDAKVDLNPPSEPVPLPDAEGSVVFDNVSFGYTDRRMVLENISFRVAPGEFVAIVGETGSGKSALLNLIPRFYDPAEGRVLIDGHDVRTLDLQGLRKRVGFVFQESFLFSDSVAANIAFGDPDVPFERIVAAAKIAQAHDFILALPQGYNTILGESGVDLSGGQRQRLSIARALLGDPTILVLDDPTAAIDPDTEQDILDGIDEAMEDRTIFLVAHRLSTLQRADRIFVLDEGRIVQEGTHAQLVHDDGPYKSAAMHQLIDEESRRQLAMEIGLETTVVGKGSGE